MPAGIGAVTSTVRSSHLPYHATLGTPTRRERAAAGARERVGLASIIAVVTGSQPILAKPRGRPSAVKSWSTGVTKPEPPTSVPASSERRLAELGGEVRDEVLGARAAGDGARGGQVPAGAEREAGGERPPDRAHAAGPEPVVGEEAAGGDPTVTAGQDEVGAAGGDEIERDRAIAPGRRRARSDQQLRQRRRAPVVPMLLPHATTRVVSGFSPILGSSRESAGELRGDLGERRDPGDGELGVVVVRDRRAPG